LIGCGCAKGSAHKHCSLGLGRTEDTVYPVGSEPFGCFQKSLVERQNSDSLNAVEQTDLEFPTLKNTSTGNALTLTGILGLAFLQVGIGLIFMKVLVVDDHGLFRDGVCLLIRRMDIGIDTILEAGDAQSGLALAAKHTDLSIILLDINLPDLSGASTVRAFRRTCISASLVLLSAVDDLSLVRRCMNEGAQGFIHKSANAETILTALRRILNGEAVWIDPSSKLAALEEMHDVAAVTLTPRQMDVLARLCQGWSNKEIARDLLISDNTVRIHVAAILQSLGARNRSEAIVVARDLGLIGG